jgi:hypothetical protein
MKKFWYVLIAFSAISIFSMPSGANALFVETFDSGNAGWLAPTVNNGGGQTFPGAAWQSSGGVADSGYISGIVGTAADRLYGLQAPFRTDQPSYPLFENLTGKTLTVDYKKVSGEVTGPTGMMVRFYIGMYTDGNLDYFVTSNAYSWNPNSAANWTTYQVLVNEANFIRWPNQANSRTFADVAAHAQDIGLVFADGFTSNETLGFSGAAVLGIDNFGTVVPIPGAFWLFGSGLPVLMILRMRRKLNW